MFAASRRHSCEGRAMASAHEGKVTFEDFTGQTENWFSQAQQILEQAETGELPPERGGGYLEPPRWRTLLSSRLAVVCAGAAVVLGGAIVWAVG